MTGSLKRILLLICIHLTCFASIQGKYPVSKPYKIKVRIAKELSLVEVSGTDLKRNLHPINQQKVYGGRKKIKFNCKSFVGNNKSNGRLTKPIFLASLNSSTGLVTFDKKKYQGDLHIVTSKKNNSCDVINELEMDDYISSLLSKEMNASWPIEALKAQAVAARTYALNKMLKSSSLGHNFYDLENSEKHQVNGDFFDVTKRTLKAARQTSGVVLTNSKGQLIPAFFHASCGGKTLKPVEVWSNKVFGYKNANCDYCKTKKNWDSQISRERFGRFLAWAMRKNYIKKVSLKSKFRIYKDKKSRKNLHVKIGKSKIKIKKSLFRRYFGRVQFPSNNFYIADGLAKGSISLVGKGNGHGVGLCQVGSKGLADRGWGHKKILAHYFPDLKLEKLY